MRSSGKRLAWHMAIGAAGIVFAIRTRGTWLNALQIGLIAVVCTLLLSPVCTAMERRRIPAGISALVSVLLLVVSAVILLGVLLPYIANSALALVRRIEPMLSYAAELLLPEPFTLAPEEIGERATLLLSAAAPITATLARGGAAFAGMIGKAAFSLIVTYYLLTMRRRLGKHALLTLPIASRKMCLGALDACRNTLFGYLSGVIKTSLFVGIATFIGLSVIGIEDAWMLAVFMAFFEVLPYIGPVIASIPILLCALSMGLWKALLSLGVIVVVQQMESGFIGPYFTASSVSVHPLCAMVCVFLGGGLFGAGGILLAVPVFVAVRSLVWSIKAHNCDRMKKSD